MWRKEKRKRKKEIIMNIQSSINKLMMAIKQNGNIIKLDTRTYYSDKANKYVSKYELYEKRIVEKDFEEKEKWISIWEGYNKVELLKKLVFFYKEGEANRYTNRKTKKIY